MKLWSTRQTHGSNAMTRAESGLASGTTHSDPELAAEFFFMSQAKKKKKKKRRKEKKEEKRKEKDKRSLIKL